MQTEAARDHQSGRNSLWGAILTGGFATALVLWTAWFVTHLPWTGLAESTSVPILLAMWALALTATGWSIGGPAGTPRDGWKVGGGAGLLSAVIGLLVLGTKISESSAASHVTQSASRLVPGAPIIVGGFLVTGAVLGAVFGFLGARFRVCRCSPSPDWLARFAVVCVVTTAPLLFIGGLVTSTNSGMAVPDWPGTYGSNMFLYPLGPRIDAPGGNEVQPEAWQKFLTKSQIADAEKLPADERDAFVARVATQKIFLEHSHRLFGALLGLSMIVLTAWVFVEKRPRGLSVLASCALLLVVAQGVLGGMRVTLGSVDSASDNRLLSMAHGVLAQLTMGLLVVLAMKLSPAYQQCTPAPRSAMSTRARIFATAAFHATIVQLIFGAIFRHFRTSSHSLWSHAGFSIVVVVTAALGAMFVMRLVQSRRDEGHDQPFLTTTSRLAGLLLAVVSLQFVLGWVALMGGNIREANPATVTQALIRTIHQANGAATLALVVAVWCAARRTAPKLTITV